MNLGQTDSLVKIQLVVAKICLAIAAIALLGWLTEVDGISQWLSYLWTCRHFSRRLSSFRRCQVVR